MTGRNCCLGIATAALAAAGAAAQSPAEYGPYVLGVTESAAQIVWITDDARPADVAVTDGETGEAAGAPPQIEARGITGVEGFRRLTAAATGLRPGREYRYSIRQGDRSREGRFRTATPAGATAPVRFVVYGDPQDGLERHGRVVQAVLKELPFDFLAVTGDLTDNTSKWELVQPQFFAYANELLARTALWTARGNHDADGRIYRDVFVPSGGDSTGSFHYGNLHYVVLDGYAENSARRKDDRQMAEMIAWLRRDVAAARPRTGWLIVAYHEPSINVGGHGEEWRRQELLPVLEELGVDLVLSGHSHLYERFRPVGAAGRKPVIFITSGGGGGPTYNTYPSPILEASYGDLHYCVFDIAGDRLEMVAKTPEGKEIDRFRLVKRDGNFSPEILARALPPEEILPLVKVFKLHRLSPERRPEGGVSLAGTLPADSFPAGYRVRLEAAADSPWRMAPLDFTADGGPVRLDLTPPAGVRLAATPWMGTFNPPLAVNIRLEKNGIVHAHDRVSVLLPLEDLRRLAPAPEPAAIPPAPAALSVDGDPGEWKDVPFAGGSRRIRLAWRPDGLYGAVEVEDPDVRAGEGRAWRGDGVEIGIETDRARRLSISRTERRAFVFFLPAGEGVLAPAVRAGRLEPGAVTAVGRRTAGGYRIEFHVRADALAPAAFRAGGTLGFDGIVRDGGEAADRFGAGDTVRPGDAQPFAWGALRFADR